MEITFSQAVSKVVGKFRPTFSPLANPPKRSEGGLPKAKAAEAAVAANVLLALK